MWVPFARIDTYKSPLGHGWYVAPKGDKKSLNAGTALSDPTNTTGMVLIAMHKCFDECDTAVTLANVPWNHLSSKENFMVHII